MDCAPQAPLSREFSRQEYWSGLSFPSPGYLPNPGIEPGSPALQADSLPSEPPGKPLTISGKHPIISYNVSGQEIYILIFSGSAGKESACNVGDLGLIPGLGRSLGEGNGYPAQYSCLKN